MRGHVPAAILLSIVVAQSARAEDPPTPAAQLFFEGRRLMGEGKIGEACTRFEESQKLDPGLGTLFNLSDCYEKLGRVASAWRGFTQVASSARGAGQRDRERIATERARALEPRLPRLTIQVPANAPQWLKITLDGAALDQASWGKSAPVDPGAHRAAASAPGRVSWEGSTNAAEGQQATLTVPELTPTASSAPASAEPAPVSRTQATVGMIVGASGIVVVGVGVVLVTMAVDKDSESKTHCLPDQPNLCDDRGVELRDGARSLGNVATVTLGVGAAAIVAGGVLWLTAPRDRSARAGASLGVVSVGDIGLGVRGAF